MPDEHDAGPHGRHPSPPVRTAAPASKGLLYLAVAASILLGGAALVVFLLYLGDRGNTMAGPLSLYGTIVSLVMTMLLWAVDRNRIQIPLPRHRRPRRVLRWGVVGVVAGAMVSAPYLVDVAVRDRQIPITESVTLLDARDMRNGSVATVEIPEPARRNGLVLRPVLTNPDRLGNCVGSAYLGVELRVDGVSRETRGGVVPGSDVVLPLDGADRTAAVAITTVIPRDTDCRVDLSVAEAYLFTRSPS